MADDVAVDRHGTALGVDQTVSSAWADETHRHSEAGLVERRNPTCEHVLAIAPRGHMAHKRDTDRLSRDIFVENQQYFI